MAWIETISFEAATDRLKELYQKLGGLKGKVDNILTMHSLRPHTMEGHLALYRSVLHNPHNQLPRWFLECLGVWVSSINNCEYCFEHHYQGMRRELNDEVKAVAVRKAIENFDINGAIFTPREMRALHYAKALTQTPPMPTEELVISMRSAGLSDGEILEINQVVAYFAYANRTVLGLGCSLEGDQLGEIAGN
jgi:uncharacterized peroxidase-related enzyme